MTKAAPWERPAPRSAHHSALTPSQKQHAKARAKKAGRAYPNLVDNMHEASAAGGAHKKAPTRKAAAKSTSRKKTSSPAKRTTTKRAPAKRTTTKRAPAKGTPKRTPAKGKTRAAPYTLRKPRTKDPKGGLTAAGRRAFHDRDGSNLKPGVTKAMSEMTPQEMRRKGSWAARFYGREGSLPALLDSHGKPTRFALTAAAWGEPVPKTVAQARAIAAKGRRLLERAKKRSA